MKDKWAFEFRILIRKEEELWVAHCLELDLVATAPSEKQLEEDIVNVIVEQVSYCLTHDNLDYLFRRAPQEIWDEYIACAKQSKPKVLRKRREPEVNSRTKMPEDLPPFSFTANTCWSPAACHAV